MDRSYVDSPFTTTRAVRDAARGAAAGCLLAEFLRLDGVLGARHELEVAPPLTEAWKLPARRATHQQTALIVDEHERGERRRAPHELEGDS